MNLINSVVGSHCITLLYKLKFFGLLLGTHNDDLLRLGGRNDFKLGALVRRVFESQFLCVKGLYNLMIGEVHQAEMWITPVTR